MKVKNPLFCVDMPDPDLLRVGKVWYMVSTTMFYLPGGPIRRSAATVMVDKDGHHLENL